MGQFEFDICRDYDDPLDPDVLPTKDNQAEEMPLDEKPKRGRGRPAKYPVGVSTAATILTTMASTGVNPRHQIVQIIQDTGQKDVERPHVCGVCQRGFKEVGFDIMWNASQAESPMSSLCKDMILHPWENS